MLRGVLETPLVTLNYYTGDYPNGCVEMDIRANGIS